MRRVQRRRRGTKLILSLLGLVILATVYWFLRQHFSSVVAGIAGVVTILFFVAVVGGYLGNWHWTGLGHYTYPKVDTQEVQHQKTLWDWMQLLIVPAVLAGGALLFNAQSAQTQMQIANDNQREEALQVYIDDISRLLLDRNLGNSKAYSQVRNVARTKTMSTLVRLDSKRQGTVLQFLRESGLIVYEYPEVEVNKHPIVSLLDANLQGVTLVSVNLSGVNLSHVDFQGANLERGYFTSSNLSSVNLQGANLREASLYEAHLVHADLRGANLQDSDLRRINQFGVLVLSTPGELTSPMNLTNANLKGANLEEALLREADLVNANLTSAVLTNADLRYANLLDAILDDATVADANLAFANLSGASITQEQLATCKSLKGATLPDGTKVPDDQDFPLGWK